MLSSIYLNAGGALANETRMDVVANNLANVNTPGFRRQFAVFQQRMPEVWEPPQLDPGFDPVLNRMPAGMFVHETTYSNQGGPIRQTESPLDLAIQGQGWFPIEQGGETLYTRAGNFTRGTDGTLRTADGQGALLDEKGKPIQVPSGGDFTVSGDGIMKVDGKPLARIQVVGELDYRQFSPRGGNLFRYTGAGDPAAGDGLIEQGFLEQSSVQPVVEMVNMIRTHRAYEANQQMIRQQDQALGRTVNDIARVN